MTEAKPRIKHPGKTQAQRVILDKIGCGDNSPPMSKATRDAMLRAGLIVQLDDLLIPLNPQQPHGLQIHVDQFEMPVATHIAWCEYWAAQPFDEEASEST